MLHCRVVEFLAPSREIFLVDLHGCLAWNGVLLSHGPEHGLPFRICGRYDVQEVLETSHTSCERRFCRGQLVLCRRQLMLCRLQHVAQLRDFIIPSLAIRGSRSRNIVDGTNPQHTSLFPRSDLKKQ